MHSKNKIILLIVFFGFITASLFLLKVKSKPTVNDEITQEGVSPEKEEISRDISPRSEETLSVSFKTESLTWEKEKTYEAEVSFDGNPDPYPTAVSVQLIYDPKVIKIEKIDKGDLWTGTNVLQTKIDNQKGEALFAAGQGFGETTTQNRVLAKVSFSIISFSEKDIAIEIGPESYTASVGVDHLINLKGSPLSVKILK